jgi:predicted GNAT family acetyltransferase
MSAEDEAIEVVDHEEAGRFEVREDGVVIGLAQYVLVPGHEGTAERIVFFHTEVDEGHEGRGLGATLAAAALDRSIAAGRLVVPVCPYIAAYVRRHRDRYAAHVSAPTAADLEAVRSAA